MTKETFDALTLERGTLVKVDWCDVLEDSSGDSDTADVMRRGSYAIFWDMKLARTSGEFILVITSTIDPDGPHNQGYTAIPLSLVTAVEIIRRPKKKRVRKSTGATP